MIIDIVEEPVINNIALAKELAHELKLSNVSIALDNFGQRYSTLKQVEELFLFSSNSIGRLPAIAASTR